jgi:hypothetical protein
MDGSLRPDITALRFSFELIRLLGWPASRHVSRSLGEG